MRVPILDYPTCISELTSPLKPIFSPDQLAYFKKYVTGLFISVNKTIPGINRLFVFDRRNQISFNRFFTASSWDINQLNRCRLDLLQTQSHTQRKPSSGVMIIDDTHNEKYGQKFDNITKLYNHSKRYYHWSHNLVTSHYSDSKTDYPLGFRTYDQMEIKQAIAILDQAGVAYDKDKFSTYRPSVQRTKLWDLLEKHQLDHPFLDKNDLACQLIDEAAQNGFGDPVVFDTWFTGPKTHNHLTARGRSYVGQLKANRNILVGDDWQHIEMWSEQLVKDHQNPQHNKYNNIFREISFMFKGVKKTYWAFSKVIRISKLERQRVVISFKDADLSGTPKFFVCNNKQWNAAKILSLGRHRWPVEPFYEISKGLLGLDSYELRDFTGVEKHWALVFFAYSIVKLHNPDCLMRNGDDIQQTFGDGLRAIQKEILLALCAYCYQCGKDGEPLDQMLQQLLP